jgi:RNA polymerase sigma factor (sigma-70 family)
MPVARKDQTTGADPDSLVGLFAALEEPLLRYAWRFLQDSEAAQDVVQEAFMKLHDQFDSVKTPRSWLFRTVHNLALNQIRAGRKLVTLDFTEGEGAVSPVDADPLPDEHLQRMEAIGQARLLIEELDERSRELIRLKFEEGLSYKEMAARMKLSVGNVGFILSTTLKRIGADLEKTGVYR